MTTKQKMLRYTRVIQALITGVCEVPNFKPNQKDYEDAFYHLKKAHSILTGLEKNRD